jgi:hypothetical protein
VHLIIRDFWERRQAGVVLAASRTGMRVAFPNRDDAVDLIFTAGHWLLEGEGPVDVDALLLPADVGQSQFGLPPLLQPERAAAAVC